MAEQTVTATSKNTYSNRNAVAALYASDPTLKASRFWYHAELFDNGRLRRLLSTATPDLVKVLDNPELLKPRAAVLLFLLSGPRRSARKLPQRRGEGVRELRGRVGLRGAAAGAGRSGVSGQVSSDRPGACCPRFQV